MQTDLFDPVRIVHYVVKRYFNQPDPQEREELISDGLEVVVEVMRSYQQARLSRKGEPVDLKSYAVLCLRRGISYRLCKRKGWAYYSNGKCRLQAKPKTKRIVDEHTTTDLVNECKEIKEYVEHLLGTTHLNDQHRSILHLYYWRGQTLQEIGDQVDLDRQRIHYIRDEALQRLRSTAGID